MKSCLVNLFDLDPPRNGGLSRVAFVVCDLLAQYADQQKLKVYFAVGWKYSGSFRGWLGRSGGEVIPVLPNAGMTPLLQSIKPDLVVSPLFGMKPIADWESFREIPHIVSMPDALALDKPELFGSDELAHRREVYNQLKQATEVVVLSEDARSRLIHHLDLRPEKVSVVFLAGDLDVESGRTGTEEETTGRKQITSPYILYPARNWPHKRHDLLMEVMSRIHLVRKDINLVLTGWFEDGYLTELASQHKFPREQIIDMGYVNSDAEMVSLYKNADALMFVSSYEGFGMPVLEAMQNGCPVICAPLTSIPEVAGDAALYVDSDDPRDWADAFINNLPLMRDNIIQKGFQQAKKFTWRETQLRWRDLIDKHLSGVETTSPSSLQYSHELQVWADQYRITQDEMGQKERVLQTLHANNKRLQEDIHLLHIQLSEKEKTIQEFRTSFSFGLLNGPFRGLSIFRFLRPVVVRLRDIRRLFLPKVGVLEQHHPKPLEIPDHYRISRPAHPAHAPRISIVTPSFNQAKYIERTIKSILDQGYPNLEYVVQDGGSTDGTIDVVQPYVQQLTHFESRRDHGQAHAINLGVQHTSGEIMAYLNSDDILLPGSLNYVAEYFSNNPDVDVIYSHRVVINEKDEEIGRWILPRHDNQIILWADYVPQETLFWRRSIWEKAGNQMDESYQFALDWDMLVRFRAVGAKFVRVPRFLAAFRVQSAQKTSMHINSVGLEEMDRLRRKIHKRDIDWVVILKKTKPYLNRSVIYHKLHWLGVLRY